MKRLDPIGLAVACCLILTLPVQAQEKTTLSLNLGYFNDNDRVQHLVASARTRVNGKFRPRDSVPVRFYLSDGSPGNLLGRSITNARGDAVLFIPAAAKDQWVRSPKQSFLVVADSSDDYGPATTTLDITKAKIDLDTTTGKEVIATVSEQGPTGWTPVKGVDVILAVKRQGSNLNFAKTPVYTTDSSGKASAAFQLNDLPGDADGNLILIAKLDANDAYGTISKEKKVPWGVPRPSLTNFDKRTLYARRGLAPIWLGFIAYSISLAVWCVIIYLVFRIREIRKIGLHLRTSPK